MTNEIKNNNIIEQELEQVAGGVYYKLIPAEEHLVDKYSGVIGNTYWFKKPGFTFVGVLLDSYEKKNFLFGTTRYHKVRVKYDFGNNFRDGSTVEINGDDWEMYES